MTDTDNSSNWQKWAASKGGLLEEPQDLLVSGPIDEETMKHMQLPRLEDGEDGGDIRSQLKALFSANQSHEEHNKSEDSVVPPPPLLLRRGRTASPPALDRSDSMAPFLLKRSRAALEGLDRL
ncbi:expressed unknown protein [Seminavis robusta]|uniref:Uncharacterized protein n=1 Tax=Seminavis robusta TaxID=568900 RepID=A0A9N8HAG6_9STRA|nr:expressed unknown protein [Seminavis robusta]|eukprot:Sro241_g096350.1 n/a (123) ;mRNA; r:43496-43864